MPPHSSTRVNSQTAAVGDRERRALVPDVDDDDRGVGRRAVARGGPTARSSANASRSMPTSSMPASPERLDVALDRLAVGGDEQDLPVDGAALVDLLAHDAVVDDRLVDRDRDGLVGAEEHRVRELALVVDAGDVEAADADVVRREPEPDAAARQRVEREELVERGRERRRRRGPRRATTMPGGSGCAGQLPQVRRAVVHDPRGRELRRADLEADELAVLRALPRGDRAGLPCGAARPPRLPNEVGKLDFLLEVDHWLHLRLGKDSEPVAGRAPELEEREVAALEQAAQLFRVGRA